MHPATRSHTFDTAVNVFEDGGEQRWARRAKLVNLVLNIKRVNSTDRDSVDTFWASTKGSFDSTWDITLGSDTYYYMGFQDNILTWVETTPGRFSAKIRCRQTRKN
jgi:hypothetical protein